MHERMSRLREVEIGLDGTICAGVGEVRVHLSYIAGCSQTLYDLITDLMIQGKTAIRAGHLSLTGMQLIVDYCYAGEIEITEETYECILDAALGLGFPDIAEKCVQFAEEA